MNFFYRFLHMYRYNEFANFVAKESKIITSYMMRNSRFWEFLLKNATTIFPSFMSNSAEYTQWCV